MADSSLSINFPDLTGSYQVARKDYCWTDLTRLEIYNSESSYRQVIAMIYFPAISGVKRSWQTLYETKLMKPFINSIPELKNYEFRTHAILEEVPTAAGQFPVIIFSHGFCTTLSHYTYLCENVASYGFIVVGIEHPYISGVAPNGSNVEEISRAQVLDVCFEDIKFILTKLKTLNLIDPILRNKLLLRKIGMFGHSLGGMNTIRVCKELTEINCGLILDTPLFFMRQSWSKGFSKPLFFFQSKRYIKEQFKEPYDPEANCDGKINKQLFKMFKKQFRNCIFIFNGVTHMDFTDLSIFKVLLSRKLHIISDELWPKGLLGNIDGIAFHIAISTQIARFFRTNFLLVNIPKPLTEEQILETIELNPTAVNEDCNLNSKEMEIFKPYIPSWEQIVTINNGIKDSGAEYFGIMLHYNNPITGITGWAYDAYLAISGFDFKQKSLQNLDFFQCLFRNFMFNLDPRFKIVGISGFQQNDPKSRPIISWLKKEFMAQVIPDDSKNRIIILLNLNVSLKERLAIIPEGICFKLTTQEEYVNSICNFEKEPEPQGDPIGIVVKNTSGNLLHEPYGVFLRNAEEKILGGAVCKIEDYTHMHVGMLWVHASMRGRKLSEKLLFLAEKHARDRGCKTAGVSTCSFQAPWLYPKLGYGMVSSIPISNSAIMIHYKKKF